MNLNDVIEQRNARGSVLPAPALHSTPLQRHDGNQRSVPPPYERGAE